MRYGKYGRLSASEYTAIRDSKKLMALREEEGHILNEIDRITAMIEDGEDTEENCELVNTLELAQRAMGPEMQKQIDRLEADAICQ